MSAELSALLKREASQVSKVDLAEAMSGASWDWGDRNGLGAQMSEAQIFERWLHTPPGGEAYGLYKSLHGPSVRAPVVIKKSEPTGALQAIYKKAETIREDNLGLTREQAFAKAMEKQPDLYTEYRRERLAMVR